MDVRGLVVAVFGLLTGISFLRFAISAGSPPGSDALKRGSGVSERDRIQRADDERERISPVPRYIVSGVGFAIAIVVIARIVPPTVGYAIVCLALAGLRIADQIAEERAPRRRAAVLGRSRRVDPVLLTWIGLSAASALLLVPWLLGEATRVSTIIVGLCVAAMVVVAWRVANAPLLLLGNDLEAEQVVDRETRVNRTGNACFLSVAAVSVFVGFLGDPLGPAALALGFVLFAWKSIYVRRLSHQPLAS